MREGDTEGFGGNGRGMREGRRGRERDSGIWVRSVEVNSRNKCRRKMRRQRGNNTKGQETRANGPDRTGMRDEPWNPKNYNESYSRKDGRI